MSRTVHTRSDVRSKRRGLRLATFFASGTFVAGAVIIPASSAMAAPMPASPAVSLAAHVDKQKTTRSTTRRRSSSRS